MKVRERAANNAIDRGRRCHAPARASLLTAPVPGYRPPPGPIGRPTRRAGGGPQPPGESRADRLGDQTPQPAARATGPILVVDDDQSILATVRDILELEGYPVVAVADGAEALRHAAADRPSLVLLDMRMPGLNGWEIARRLRAGGIAVPLLVMTAAQDARLWAEQVGAAGYLAKPFDLDELLTAVERLRRA